ncbi:caspase-14-like isoform X2 [Meriones unguiculatus]|uniref:caspase-14-like isoform X2 n=1 Tax=Meriones unguiculatus TaxID=10047 RepID=UPI00293E08D8|nr:caspase-14-like isoform X2 [Meriones unguiculatus]
MAFLVSGTLWASAQLADAWDSLGRKGKYSVQGSRVALVLSSPGVSATAAAALDGVSQALGFETCEKRVVPVQSFLEELRVFREQLDVRRAAVGCALVVLMAPSGQLRQPQLLVKELSHCGALQGRPKIFLLLLSSGLKSREPAAFLAALGEICSQHPHWSLLQLLTELFCRVAEEAAGNTHCPVFRTSLRGSLCLGAMDPWRPESDPGPRAQYDLSGTRAALLLAVTQDRPGAQHDVAALRDLCQALGFKVTLRTDPSAQAFWEELVQFREKLDTHKEPVSCALVALMAHGGPQGQLLGADGREVQPELLVGELSCCRALRGCPKIFLLQACRGENRDPGVGPRALPWYWRWLRAPPVLPTHADVLQVHADFSGSSSSTPGSSGQADILTVYAAAEGCVAYRDEKGSDFVQTLVEVIRANAGGDLLELLTEVNRRVCELDVLGPDSEELRKACLEIRSSLRRGLRLKD